MYTCEYGCGPDKCGGPAEFRISPGDFYPMTTLSCRGHLATMNSNTRMPSVWTVEGITERAKVALEKWKDQLTGGHNA